MGAVGLPRTFWLPQIPTRKTPGTASTEAFAVIYFYPGSMPSRCTQLHPFSRLCEYQRIVANRSLYTSSTPIRFYGAKKIKSGRFGLLEKSSQDADSDETIL